MAQTLLAVLLVLACAQALPDLARIRDFTWLHAWTMRWTPAADGGSSRSGAPAALIPLIVFFVAALVQALLDPVLFGLPAFAFAVAVLYYCWGPRDLDADLEAVLKAPDTDRRHAAAQALRPDPAVEALPLASAALVEAAFGAALSRWFGVLFWFVVLGPAGALGYRIVQLLARNPAFAEAIDADQRALLDRTARILDWAPAHLMAFGLALVSEFDTVLKTWRDYCAAPGRGYFTLDLGFLGALARAGIDADVIADGNAADELDNPLVELADAGTVLRRILVSWLALMALVALAGWVR